MFTYIGNRIGILWESEFLQYNQSRIGIARKLGIVQSLLLTLHFYDVNIILLC